MAALTVREARANLARMVAKVQAHVVGGEAEHLVDVPDGVMIAFYPPAALARQLAIEGGEPASELHVTLALPGKLSELTSEQKKRLPDIVRGFALISRPLEGVFGGVTTFPAHDGVKPVVLLVDVPGLPAWRQRLVEILALNGFTVANDHGFLPHLTLQYAPEDAEITVETPTVPLRFETVTLMMGEEKRTYRLGGNPEVDESLESFAAQPAKRREETAVAAYQAALAAAYDDWLAAAWPQLAEAEDDSDRDALLALLLPTLLLTLQRVGATHLPAALAIGVAKVSGAVTTTAMLTTVGDALTANNAYLANNLIPAIREKILAALTGGAAGGTGEAATIAEALQTALGSLSARVGAYAGDLWSAIQQITGLAIEERAADGGGLFSTRVIAYLDPGAAHCHQCPEFHWEKGKVYESWAAYLEATSGRVPGDFECGGNCRCWVEGDDGEFAA